MRWNERLRIALPELFRLDGRTIGLGILLGAGIQFPIEDFYHVHQDPYFLLGLPLARGVLWLADVCNAKRLRQFEIDRALKSYRQGRDRVKKLRKECIPTGIQLVRKKDYLSADDRRILQRIEEVVDEIERQFKLGDSFLQAQLLYVLPQVIEQATTAMEIGAKLGLLLEFLSKEDLARLESEERNFREQARNSTTGPLGALHSQTCRFKAQQIANVRNAQQDAAIYRAQLNTLEAGLGNVRGRIAAMSSIGSTDIGIEMEALDAEITALDEGMRMAARATSGLHFHAGGRFLPFETTEAGSGGNSAAVDRANEDSTDRGSAEGRKNPTAEVRSDINAN